MMEVLISFNKVFEFKNSVFCIIYGILAGYDGNLHHIVMNALAERLNKSQ